MSGKIVIPAHPLVSLVEGEPSVGVGPILPLTQVVHLHAPQNEWTFRHIEGRKFHLSVSGYPYTGVERNRVIASILPENNKEWIVTYAKLQNAFTIELADKPGYGWKVVDGQLVIGEITSFRVLGGPYYPPSELFKLKGVITIDVEKALQGEN